MSHLPLKIPANEKAIFKWKFGLIKRCRKGWFRSGSLGCKLEIPICILILIARLRGSLLNYLVVPQTICLIKQNLKILKLRSLSEQFDANGLSEKSKWTVWSEQFEWKVRVKTRLEFMISINLPDSLGAHNLRLIKEKRLVIQSSSGKSVRHCSCLLQTAKGRI